MNIVFCTSVVGQISVSLPHTDEYPEVDLVPQDRLPWDMWRNCPRSNAHLTTRS